MEMLWPQRGPVHLCTHICGSWGCLHWVLDLMVFWSVAYPKKDELDALEAVQYSYNFTYSSRNNLVRMYYISASASDPVGFVNRRWSSPS